MYNNQDAFESDQWIIWNGSLGIMDRVSIGEVELDESGNNAWLEEPYDMVGPFNLDELVTQGKIRFAACVVMSFESWQQNQVTLRQAASHARRAFQKRQFEGFARYQQRKQQQSVLSPGKEVRHRKLLNLPSEGSLNASDIKSAFRRLAQKAHPDTGGSHEQFVKITEARDALLTVANR